MVNAQHNLKETTLDPLTGVGSDAAVPEAVTSLVTKRRQARALGTPFFTRDKFADNPILLQVETRRLGRKTLRENRSLEVANHKQSTDPS